MTKRVYFDVGYKSFGIGRAALQLAKYMPPDLEIASDPDSADYVVIHVNGRRDHNMVYAQRVKAKGHQYGFIQYVLQSCRNPDPADWVETWRNAKVVWSYYDLKPYTPDNFYHAPLAADPTVFYREAGVAKQYLLGTNGNTFDLECLGEVWTSAYKAGGRVLHVGQKFGDNPIVDVVWHVPDDELRALYNKCINFSALRRKDGFEMVAIEALLCGVRPLVFDTPNYRQWFDGLVTFIREREPAKVIHDVQRVLEHGQAPVTNDEIEETKRRFNWERIITGFWERLLS